MDCFVPKGYSQKPVVDYNEIISHPQRDAMNINIEMGRCDFISSVFIWWTSIWFLFNFDVLNGIHFDHGVTHSLRKVLGFFFFFGDQMANITEIGYIYVYTKRSEIVLVYSWKEIDMHFTILKTPFNVAKHQVRMSRLARSW